MARGNQRPRRTPTMGSVRSTSPTLGANRIHGVSQGPGGGNFRAVSNSPYDRLKQGQGIKYDAQGRAQGWTTPKPPAPANPMIAPTVGGVIGNPVPKAPTWKDADYGDDVNNLIRTTNDDRTAITGEGQRDEQNLAAMVRQMTQARGQDLLGANSNANRQGLLFSSTLGKNRSGIETDYTARTGSAQTAFNDRAASRMAALNRLGTITADPNSPNGFTASGDAGAGLGGIIAAARARVLDRNQDIEAPITPDAGAPPATPPSASGETSKKPKQYVKNGWLYRAAADGSGRILRIKKVS